jgi:CheY-like chemotaxis protein
MTAPKAISILITDDVAQNRVYLAQLIQSILKNAVIQEAENGAAARQMMAEKLAQTGSGFDLIFMDFKMPVLDGEQATLAIRELETSAKVAKQSIIITWSSAKSAPYPGADDWLPKVLGRMELERMLLAFRFI